MENREEVSEIELQKVINAIKNLYDYDFHNYAHSSLRRRIYRVINLYNLSNTDELIKKFRNEKEFFKSFLEEISVNTTEMFRDPFFWKCLQEKILPRLKELETIRIWLAGCSTGEEIFSLCILLYEWGMLNKSKILATDINNRALEYARKGKYPLRKLEVYKYNYKNAGGNAELENYIKRQKEEFKMDPSLINNVELKFFDLVKNEPYAKYDLILCRNVLIYFDKFLQNNVCNKFINALFKNGFLGIGARETLVWCAFNYKFKTISNENKIFQLEAS